MTAPAAKPARLKTISNGYRHFGHGQQLAARRLGERRAEVKQTAHKGSLITNMPGETNRQLAARLRAEAEAVAPEKPARKPRAKKAA